MSGGLMSVAQAGALREQYGYRAVIVVGIRDDGTVDVMSHARTKADCAVIGDYAQDQFGAFLPQVPFKTWFGWGNRGRAKALGKEQLRALSPSGQAYALKNTAPGADA